MAIVDKTHSLTIEEAFNKVGSGEGGASLFRSVYKTNQINIALNRSDIDLEAGTDIGTLVTIDEEFMNAMQLAYSQVFVKNLTVYVNGEVYAKTIWGDNGETSFIPLNLNANTYNLAFHDTGDSFVNCLMAYPNAETNPTAWNLKFFYGGPFPLPDQITVEIKSEDILALNPDLVIALNVYND